MKFKKLLRQYVLKYDVIKNEQTLNVMSSRLICFALCICVKLE